MGWPEQVFKWLGYGKYSASPTAVADGATSPLLIDQYGKLRVLAEISGSATYSAYKTPSGADKKGVIKSSAGSLRYVQVTSKDTVGCFFQVLNQATAPAGGETTSIVLTVWIPAGESRAINLPTDLAFSTGIAWGASTAMADCTLVSGQYLWVNAFYL